MCALDQWSVGELRSLVSRAYPFADLGDRAFTATLDMLDGRYPSQEFSQLRPRIVWDRIAGSIRGRQGAQRLAVTSGGTIPDRGQYTVNLLTDGKRVGELDEEMVYELRPGETFVLGATTWKAVEITQSQVLVAPAPGEPGKITFWHGDAVGRPVEIGRAIGALTRDLLASDEGASLAHLTEKCRCDGPSAVALLAYLNDQRAATGEVPDDKTVVVERFRDQLGDWRVCVLTPYGTRVHTPWALAAQAKLQESLGLEVQSIASDDGFALRLVDADSVPQVDELLLEPEEVREAVTAQLHGSALFASRFRENAARALLLPRLRPGSRTPLWLQRQRSADLLRVASRYPDFPILAETYRECLGDVFDLDALSELMRRIRSRAVRVVDVETSTPSPFSSSLLFDYLAQYMYEGDTPLAERRAQALTLDRELLNELLGAEDLRELLNSEVIAQTELDVQGLDPDRWPRNADEAHDCLRRLGDLSETEAAARGIGAEFLAQLAVDHRATVLRVGGEQRWIASADAAMYRDALGVSLPMGLPEEFLRPMEGPLESLLSRWAQTHVPFVPSAPAHRWNLPADLISSELASMARRGDLVVGHFRPESAEPEFCSPEVLRILRRRSLAALRHEIEPVAPAILARFEPEWQGVGVEVRGIDRLAEIITQIQGYPLPVSVIERDVLASRMSGYSAQLLDQLVGSGEVVWIGRGPLGLADGKVALYLRKDVRKLARGTNDRDAAISDLRLPSSNRRLPTADSRLANSDLADLPTLLHRRLAQGACFFADLMGATGWTDGEAVLDALWDLVWAGVVTNDMFAPLRFAGPSRRRSRRGVGRLGPPRSHGRWSLVEHLLQPSVTDTERLHGQSEMLLQRYGVLTREHAAAEGISGGFVAIYPVLRSMEEAGRIRRGYFVEGLGGAQFALAGAVDRLRSRRGGESNVILLAATDPATAYGVTLPWPELRGRPRAPPEPM